MTLFNGREEYTIWLRGADADAVFERCTYVRENANAIRVRQTDGTELIIPWTAIERIYPTVVQEKPPVVVEFIER